MAGKWMFLAVFAVLGFVGGIGAQWGYKAIQPALALVLKDILITDLLLSGFGGAALTLIIVLIWANFSKE